MLGANRATSAVDVAREAPPRLYVPACPICQQPGGEHPSPPRSERRFICATCGARWTLQPSES